MNTDQVDIGSLDFDKLFRNDIGVRSLKKEGPHIIAVGGGKGGVGKSMVSTMLAIVLGQMEFEVVLIDADFSGSNLYGYVNIFRPEKSMQRFIDNRSRDINSLALNSPFSHVRFLTGTPQIAAHSQALHSLRQNVRKNLPHLQAHFVIIDLGAGSSFQNLDFFLMADTPIVLSTCDSLSLYDAYGFIRAALFRKIQHNSLTWPDIFKKLITCGDLTKGENIRTVAAFLKEHESEMPGVCRLIKDETLQFSPRLLLNSVHPNDDHGRAQNLRMITQHVLNVKTESWGEIRHDPQVREAAIKIRPELLTTNCAALKDVEHLLAVYAPARPASKNEKAGSRYATICNHRCIAWDSCAVQRGGFPCAKRDKPGSVF
jgi:flagellar biosynthesis protein FlhG